METELEIVLEGEVKFRHKYTGEGLWVWIEELSYGEKRIFFEYLLTLCGSFYDTEDSVEEFSDSLELFGLGDEKKMSLRGLFRCIMSFR